MIPSELTKNYYSIGEVAKMFDLNTSALRFWEKEFSELKPKKIQEA
jgi:DNA-binding transcriptional MerR regulator